MAYGIRIRDASGNVVLDNNERIARCLAVLSVGVGSGSQAFNAADVGGGTLCAICQAGFNSFYQENVVTVSGNTVSWTMSEAGTIFVFAF